MGKFDFESLKSLIWAYGFMILSIIIMILGLLQQIVAIGWVSAIYLCLFLAYMFRMELKIRTQKIDLYEMLAGVKVLESNTVIDESTVEESLFYIKKVTTLDEIEVDLPKEYKNTDLSDWKVIKFELLQSDSISKYEVQTFQEFYIISPSEDTTGFHEEANTNIYFNGKSFMGTKIKGDLLFLSWILPDKPLFLLYSSPKLALPLTSLRKDLEGVIYKITQTLTQEVLDLKEKQKNFDFIIQEKLKQIDLISKRASFANARAEFIQTESLERPDPEIDPEIVHVNRGLLWFLGLGFVISAILYLSTIFGRLGL